MISAFTISLEFSEKLHQKFIEAHNEASKTVQSVQFFGAMFRFSHNAINNEIDKFSADLLGDIIKNCFYATTLTEEGRDTVFKLIFQPPRENNSDRKIYEFEFREKKEFNAHNLKKIALAVDATKFQLGVWFNTQNKLEIWGILRTNYSFFSIKAISPGTLIVKCESLSDKSFTYPLTFLKTGFVSISNPLVN